MFLSGYLQKIQSESRDMKIIGFLLLVAAMVSAAQKQNKKDITQVLELPKDPPLAVAADTRNLIFNVTPLSNKGLLSQQTRDAVKALMKLNNGAPIVKIRAFVVGSGDMRRVPAIVSEMLTDKKMALPAVTVVQAGGLPMEGAQVVLETIATSKREVNTYGLAFVGGQRAMAEDPLAPIMPLAEKAMAGLDSALMGVSSEVLRVTCFTSSREEAPRLQSVVAKRYAQAMVNVVSMQRASAHSTVECEATARLENKHTAPLEFLNDGRAAAVSATKIVMTGTQMAFGLEDKDARLAFQRLERALEPLGTTMKNLAMADFYPLSNSIGEQIRKVRAEFLDPHNPPVTTMLPFEGLPSMGASFAMDVVAVVNQ
jgi:enamine deaminase RidA (YjgF/YER057c/UK114 family)